MLNPNWKTRYTPEDFSEWQKMNATTPPFFGHSFSIIEKLLGKYFRSKSGSTLSPEYNWYQKKEILDKTMKELEKAVCADSDECDKMWKERQEAEESLDSKLEREKGMYESKNSSTKSGMRRISTRDVASAQKPIITPPKKPRPQYDQKELARGIKIEMEHTSDENFAANIAMNHLDEKPEYYDMLEEMESKF